MQHVYQLARLVAARDTTVLITGETGTGKELVARGIHEISRRAGNPFVVVNCAAIPEALLEAELFGHARGAFTGAVQSRVGRIHNAHGGTLFLDEIGDLPLTMQAKLLRFLQDGEVQRLGSSDVFRVDVRVVCATNVNLLDHVKQKLFRQDLYYRIAVFPHGAAARCGSAPRISDRSRRTSWPICASEAGSRAQEAFRFLHRLSAAVPSGPETCANCSMPSSAPSSWPDRNRSCTSSTSAPRWPPGT